MKKINEREKNRQKKYMNKRKKSDFFKNLQHEKKEELSRSNEQTDTGQIEPTNRRNK